VNQEPAPPAGPAERLGLLGALAIVLMTILYATLMMQVVLRFFSLALPWLNDIAVPAVIWLVFVGSAIACRRNEHPFIEIGYFQAQRRLSPRRMAQLDAVIVCVSLVFLLVLLYGTLQMTRQTWRQTPGLLAGFRLGYVYLGAALGTLACIGTLCSRLGQLWRGERKMAGLPTDAV
jgi:TRAP-type C4-dicarboxylate transport system permease small subunit